MELLSIQINKFERASTYRLQAYFSNFEAKYNFKYKEVRI